MLNVISVENAVTLSETLARRVARAERLPLAALPGRVTAEAVRCPEEIPGFARSTMDGVAVAAADVFGAGEAAPADLTVTGEILMGEAAAKPIRRGECVKIPTGGMLPAGADAVVPVEYLDFDFDTCLVYRAVSPWETVVRSGDDARAGAALFPAGTRLTPADVGVLAAAGITECEVLARPKVGILSTGNEIVPAEAPVAPGKVRDVNAHLLEALCRAHGCETRRYGIIPDEEAALTAALQRAAAENDLALLSGGSSAGEKDLTAKVIAALGEVKAHGVAMKPGKPTVIGKIGKTPVFGLPGHPAACYFVTDVLVRPCIEVLSGAPLPRPAVTATLTENVSSNHGREEFVCVRLKYGQAAPVYGKSGVVSQLSAADGYLRIDRDREGLRRGETVIVYLF